MSRRVPVLAFVLAVSIAGPVQAEHKGPRALFPVETPEAAINRIAAECEARGFLAKRAGPTDVTCQGGELVRDAVTFRPGSPPADPFDQPQAYHRFVAEAGTEGAVVRERSVLVAKLRGKLLEIDPALVAARMINVRVAEFYQALGAKLVDS